MLRAFVTSSLLSFTGTALVMPFEVGKTLAQVQWVPKEGLDNIVQATLDEVEEESVEVSFAIRPFRVGLGPFPGS
jgi:mitochondrial fusion and transport protein UGO1